MTQGEQTLTVSHGLLLWTRLLKDISSFSLSFRLWRLQGFYGKTYQLFGWSSTPNKPSPTVTLPWSFLVMGSHSFLQIPPYWPYLIQCIDLILVFFSSISMPREFYFLTPRLVPLSIDPLFSISFHDSELKKGMWWNDVKLAQNLFSPSGLALLNPQHPKLFTIVSYNPSIKEVLYALPAWL